MAKYRTDKRPISARALAEKFDCSPRTIQNFWSQSRADYLAENSISRNKPWRTLKVSRATWYNYGKPETTEELADRRAARKAAHLNKTQSQA